MNRTILRCTHRSISEKGKRPRNEDTYFPLEKEEHQNLFFVCDGLGGHGDGDLAAAFVQSQFAEEVFLSKAFTEESLEQAVLVTNSALKRYAAQIGNLQMGSTIAAVKVLEKEAILTWVGDSRIYLVRNGQLIYKTKDHTMLQLLRDTQEDGKPEMDSFGMKNVIYQALGPIGSHLKPSTETLSIITGDILFLATDGVFEALNEAELLHLLEGDKNIAAENIRHRCALLSRDNYTFTIVEIS